jgi:hypothetical protein
LLPTAGSVVGGVLAAPLDPFTGGLASVAAAGLGSSLGKMGENSLTHQGIDNGVLGAAAGGALGQGVGKIAGGVLGKASGLLSNAADKVESNVAQKGADAIYRNIPKGLRQSYDLAGTTNLAKQLGVDVTNPSNLTGTAQNAIDILNNSVNDALGQAGPVDASTYNDIIKSAIADKSGVLGSYDPVAVSRGRLGMANTPAAKLLQQLEGYGAGVAKTDADPTAVRALLQKVGSAFSDANPTVTAATGAKDPVQVATHDTLGEVYNNLKNLLYNRPEVAQNFGKLEGNLQAADVGGNQQLADYLNNIILGADNHQPVLDTLQQFGNMNSLGKAAISASKGMVSAPAVAPSTSSLVGNLVKGAAGGGHIGMGAALAGHVVNGGADVLGAGGSILDRIAPLAPSAGAALGSAVTTGADTPLQTEPLTSTMQQGTSMQPQSTNIFDALTNPGSGMSANYAPIALQALAGMFDPNLLNQYSGAANNAEKNIQAAQTASSTLPNLMNEFNQAGGGQGLVGGVLSRLSGLLPGTPASNYAAQANEEAQALSRATGVPITAAELPQLTQNNQTASDTIARLQSLLQTLGANTSGSVLGAAIQ